MENEVRSLGKCVVQPFMVCTCHLGALNDDTKILTETDIAIFFSDTKTKTEKKLAKVSRPKGFKTEMSISAEEEAIAS